jgi:esterase/lipase superfamily enzyme
MTRLARAVVGSAGTLLVAFGTACGRTVAYRLPFMQPPAHLGEAEPPAFRDTARVGAIPSPSLLYATVRRPNPAGYALAYGDERAIAVRVGSAAITFSDSSVTWDEARRIALLKTGTSRSPLRVAEVREFGTIDRTERFLLEDSVTQRGDSTARLQLSEELRRRLANRAVKDVYVYVHGYKVNFDNPPLEAAELWHFLGYEGVLMPFAWPSHIGRLDYLTDTETARYSAPLLRDFL